MTHDQTIPPGAVPCSSPPVMRPSFRLLGDGPDQLVDGLNAPEAERAGARVLAMLRDSVDARCRPPRPAGRQKDEGANAVQLYRPSAAWRAASHETGAFVGKDPWPSTPGAAPALCEQGPGLGGARSTSCCRLSPTSRRAMLEEMRRPTQPTSRPARPPSTARRWLRTAWGARLRWSRRGVSLQELETWLGAFCPDGGEAGGGDCDPRSSSLPPEPSLCLGGPSPRGAGRAYAWRAPVGGALMGFRLQPPAPPARRAPKSSVAARWPARSPPRSPPPILCAPARHGAGSSATSRPTDRCPRSRRCGSSIGSSVIPL